MDVTVTFTVNGEKRTVTTDRGRPLLEVLREDLEANQVKPNIEMRAKLTMLCRTDIKDVESLPTLVKSLKKNVMRRSTDRHALRRKQKP